MHQQFETRIPPRAACSEPAGNTRPAAAHVGPLRRLATAVSGLLLVGCIGATWAAEQGDGPGAAFQQFWAEAVVARNYAQLEPWLSQDVRAYTTTAAQRDAVYRMARPNPALTPEVLRAYADEGEAALVVRYSRGGRSLHPVMVMLHHEQGRWRVGGTHSPAVLVPRLWKDTDPSHYRVTGSITAGGQQLAIQYGLVFHDPDKHELGAVLYTQALQSADLRAQRFGPVKPDATGPIVRMTFNNDALDFSPDAGAIDTICLQFNHAGSVEGFCQFGEQPQLTFAVGAEGRLKGTTATDDGVGDRHWSLRFDTPVLAVERF